MSKQVEILVRLLNDKIEITSITSLRMNQINQERSWHLRQKILVSLKVNSD